MAQDCSDCLYFVSDTCRRYAPTSGGVTAGVRAAWPQVDASDWCGEWRDVLDNWRSVPEPVNKTAIDALAAAVATAVAAETLTTTPAV